MMIWEINTTADVCAIASNVLEGEIERLSGNFEAAEEFFRAGIQIEDKLNYNEPPDWFFSVRHMLGDLYLTMKKPDLAEKVYREDLLYWVKNGFALNGLYHSLLQQNKNDEAAKVQEQFAEAWKYADSQLKYSRIDELSRQNLALRVDESAPNDLIYRAGNFCSK
jgi:hypothetical protein